MSGLSDYASYTFYRTFGGGPEGGYIAGENSDGEEEVRAVERTWGTQFKVTEVPAIKPEILRLDTKTEGGLTFVRQVGEWEQVYDEPHSFSHYCPPEEEECVCETCEVSCPGDLGKALAYGSWSVTLCLDCYVKEAPEVLAMETPPEPSWTAEELARK